MPWTKGQSGNPDGRPAVNREYRERCRAYMESDGWNRLMLHATTAGGGEDWRFAMKALMEYAYGKPTQPLGGEDGQPIPILVIYEDGPPPETP